MKRNLASIIIAIVLIFFVLILVIINFSKHNENKLERYYGIIEEKIIEQEKKDLKDFKTFVVLDKYGSKEKDNKLYVYAYVLAENYYKDDDGNVIVHSGFSIPHRFEFENGEYVGYKIPQDGTYYEESLNEMYPVDIRIKMDFSKDKYNLADIVKREAAQYYQINVEEIKNK